MLVRQWDFNNIDKKLQARRAYVTYHEPLVNQTFPVVTPRQASINVTPHTDLSPSRECPPAAARCTSRPPHHTARQHSSSRRSGRAEQGGRGAAAQRTNGRGRRLESTEASTRDIKQHVQKLILLCGWREGEFSQGSLRRLLSATSPPSTATSTPMRLKVSKGMSNHVGSLATRRSAQPCRQAGAAVPPRGPGAASAAGPARRGVWTAHAHVHECTRLAHLFVIVFRESTYAK